MSGEGRIPESRRNALLRSVDWRFLLRPEGLPRAISLGADGKAEAIALISEPAAAGSAPELAVLGGSSRRRLAAARAALPPGGEVACRRILPLPGAAGRLSRALRRAGFNDVQLLWPGPVWGRLPQFWLPLGSPGAASRLLASRPPQSAAQRGLRRLWRVGLRLGALAPLWAVARVPEPGGGERDPLAAAAEPSSGRGASWLLLTGGSRSINKVVALVVDVESGQPHSVVKFARIPEADAALEREASVLDSVAARRPQAPGVPRVRARGRRGGRLALVEDAIDGRPLQALLSPQSFEPLARKVTEWLVGLAGSDPALAPEDWWQRLVGDPLARFERDFGTVAAREAAQARGLLAELGPLAPVPEHRDCSPWNVFLTPEESPAMLDWESAEPNGLPALDLTYFLANCVQRLHGDYGPDRAAARYRRLLDPSTPEGRVAAGCFDLYGSRLGIEPAEISRLRLLCWLVHSRSDYLHLEMEAAGRPDAGDLERSTFLALLRVELERAS